MGAGTLLSLLHEVRASAGRARHCAEAVQGEPRLRAWLPARPPAPLPPSAPHGACTGGPILRPPHPHQPQLCAEAPVLAWLLSVRGRQGPLQGPTCSPLAPKHNHRPARRRPSPHLLTIGAQTQPQACTEAPIVARVLSVRGRQQVRHPPVPLSTLEMQKKGTQYLRMPGALPGCARSVVRPLAGAPTGAHTCVLTGAPTGAPTGALNWCARAVCVQQGWC